MRTGVNLHVCDTKPEVAIRENYSVINLEGTANDASLFFKTESQLRDFAESILQQLDQAKELTA
jgi:hypothetical protein